MSGHGNQDADYLNGRHKEPRCGYCAQAMDFDRQCQSSTDAGRCAMYQEFAATRQIPVGVQGTVKEQS